MKSAAASSTTSAANSSEHSNLPLTHHRSNHHKGRLRGGTRRDKTASTWGRKEVLAIYVRMIALGSHRANGLKMWRLRLGQLEGGIDSENDVAAGRCPGNSASTYTRSPRWLDRRAARPRPS